MGVKPLYDRVVVRRLPAESETKTGIIIPDVNNKKTNQGEVIAVGDGALTNDGQIRKLSVNVGDHILFSQFSGSEITVEDEQLLILKEADILAIFEPKTSQEKAA